MSVISVRNLNKVYKLYEKPSDRLKDALGVGRKNYPEVAALKDVSFDIDKGETIGIIGTNGSGKSTLLKILTGVVTKTSGDVKVDGRISALLELGAGFNSDYTGVENVYLNGSMMGFTKEEIDKKLPSILEFADIGDYVYQPVKTYSSGMFVRLAFSVAINIDPEILIVDEALSVGDAFFQAKCYQKFEEFKSQGKTILFVSHDLSSILRYCDKVMLLDRGVLREVGNAREVVDTYKRLLVSYGENAGRHMKEEETAKIEGLPRNPDAKIYGEGQAEIFSIEVLDENGVLTDTIEKDTKFTIRTKTRFKSDVEDPIFTYTFKDVKGTEISGTNTLFEKINTGKVSAGESVTVTFEQDMSLQGGEYLISAGCTGYYGGNFHVYQRIYDAVHITVASTKNTVGFFDMHSKVSVSKDS